MNEPKHFAIASKEAIAECYAQDDSFFFKCLNAGREKSLRPYINYLGDWDWGLGVGDPHFPLFHSDFFLLQT